MAEIHTHRLRFGTAFTYAELEPYERPPMHACWCGSAVFANRKYGGCCVQTCPAIVEGLKDTPLTQFTQRSLNRYSVTARGMGRKCAR